MAKQGPKDRRVFSPLHYESLHMVFLALYYGGKLYVLFLNGYGTRALIVQFCFKWVAHEH